MKTGSEPKLAQLPALRRGFILGSAGLVALFLVVFGLRVPPSSVVDDAFITYRYAANVSKGLGLVYNPGEWVLGTTTPLYALLLAAGRALGLEIVALGHWVSIGAWIAAAWLAIGLLVQLRRPIAGVIAGLLISLQPLILLSLGMESALVVALMLATAWAWYAGRRWLVVLTAAALILTRQDGTLWVLFLGLEMWRSRHRFPWRELIGVGILVLPWFLFAYWRYGTLLPHSAIAKIGQLTAMSIHSDPPFWQDFGYFLQFGLGPFYLGFVLMLAVSGLYVIIRQLITLWWLPVWLGFYLAIFSQLGVVNFTWYFVPPACSLALLVALGLGELIGASAQSMTIEDEHRRWWRRLAPALLGVLLLTVLITGQLTAMVEASNQRSSATAEPKLHGYAQVGAWLANNTPADAVVAAVEIGIVGYRSQRPILDLMGLVSPDLRAHLTGWSDVFVYAVTTAWPDYIVTLKDDAVAEQQWFREFYVPEKTFGIVSLYRRTGTPATANVTSPQFVYENGLQLQDVLLPASTPIPGQPLRLWVRLEVGQAPSSNYQFTWFLVDAQTWAQVGAVDLWPYGDFNLYRSSHWLPGSQLLIPFSVELPATLAPGAYRLGLVIFDSSQQQPLQQIGAADQKSDAVQFAWLRIGDPPLDDGATAGASSGAKSALQAPSPLHINATWDDRICLDEATIELPRAALTTAATLTLQWQVLATNERDLVVFLHLLNERGEIVAQQDRRPFAGRFPTPVWRRGERLTDKYELALPANLLPGAYQVCIGLYDDAGRVQRSDAGSPKDKVCTELILN